MKFTYEKIMLDQVTIQLTGEEVEKFTSDLEKAYAALQAAYGDIKLDYIWALLCKLKGLA